MERIEEEKEREGKGRMGQTHVVARRYFPVVVFAYEGDFLLARWDALALLF